jgi:quercetin dioxygenase-like cupin family protein
MKRFNLVAVPLLVLASAGTYAEDKAATGAAITRVEQHMKSQTITRAGSQPAAKGPAEYFTGNVRIDPLFPASDTAQVSGGRVTFEPGARSAWHTHPAGQHLIVTEGVGWTQEWGGPVVEIRAGDVVSCPPGIKHWHGASPGASMTHIAITGTVNGKNVDWMEKVSDDQYRK